MSQSFRNAEGGLIDRSRELAFTYDGDRYLGYPGDTLASALLANGVHLVGRSFKYHRPRGIVTAGPEEPNALVQLGQGGETEPNIRATQIELFDGLVGASQNCWPSVNFDIQSINNHLSKFLPAGFYYKTFMWPEAAWMLYEKVIRRAAGLGKAPREADPDTYEKRYAFCDVLVVGGGPAGLSAALAAGRAGARVMLADEQMAFGGSLLSSRASIGGEQATEWVDQTTDELAAMPEVSLLPRTTVVAYQDHNYLIAVERLSDHLPRAERHGPRQRLWKIRARHVILATGALERPLVFAENDRPGIMLASAARTYVNRFGVRPGDNAVVLTNNESGYRAALDAADGGVKIAAIVDLRSKVDGPLATQARGRDIEILAGSGITGTRGDKRVNQVDVIPLTDDGKAVRGTKRTIACDLLMMSGGWNPTVHLYSQSGGKLRWDETMSLFRPDVSRQAETSVGAANGDFAVSACLSGGAAAGRAAAEAAGKTVDAMDSVPAVDDEDVGAPRAIWSIPTDRKGAKKFLDFQNDVTAADVGLAVRENYRSVEHFKRYTTTGMGTDQGKTSNVNALAILAETREEPIPEVGHTTFRPFYTATTIGAIAGQDTGADLLDPIRKTPMHVWHEQNGAKFEDVGQWKRPYCYLRDGESVADAVNREVEAARASVGILDASTLGKIDIQGPDAVELINRVYTNAFSKLAVGRCRYGLMCKDDGMVFDDGVTSRIGENHFLMSTTTGGAPTVLNWLEEWLQCEWTDLEVYCTSVTTHWAAIAIAGPNSRKLVEELTTGVDFSTEAFPFMAWQDGEVAGIPARIFRISFSGELGFEVQVPASYGLALWNALMTVGEKYAITPYGTEAMHVLRAEKGFIIAGQDTDGTTTPYDLGMDWIVSKKKPDFLGKRGLGRPDTERQDRKQLVGLETEDPNIVLPEGAHISPTPNAPPPVPMEGWVSSSYWSPNCGRSIALALIKSGRSRIGQTVSLPLEDKVVRAKIVDPVFFDPEGERLRG